MTDATRPPTRPPPIGLAGPIWLIVGALFVAGAVYSVLNVAPAATPLPAVELLDGAGRPFRLAQLSRQVWVATFTSSAAPGAPLVQLAERLPERVALVTFVIPAAGAPATPTGFGGGGLVLGGTRAVLTDLATTHFGFSAADVERALAGAAYLLASVDGAGRVSHHYVGTDGPALGEAVVAQSEFLLSLERRPRLHALLNGCSATLLLLGFAAIRARRVGLHLTFMLLAVLTTTGFLASYLWYHFHAGTTTFVGVGWTRPLYFGLLLSHTILAAFVAPLAGTVLYHAARRRFDRHRRLARWTLPMWFYVSVTGVLIYFMLYVWF